MATRSASDSEVEATNQPNNKRKRVSSNTPDHDPKFKLLITPISSAQSLTKMNPISVSRDIHKAIGQPKQIQKRGKSLLVECNNPKQLATLKNVTEIAGVPVKNKEWDPLPLPQTKGAITGIPHEVTDDELQKELAQ